MNRSVICYLSARDSDGAARVISLARALPDLEFIVVGDSSHAAAESLRFTAAGLEHVRFIQLPATLGKGAALRAGLNMACSEYVCFLDLGGVLEPRALMDLFDELEHCPDLDGIAANRFAAPARLRASLGNRVVIAAFNRYARALFKIPNRDPQGSVKMFRRASLVRLFEDLRLYNHGFDAELLFQARRIGLNVADMPVSWTAGRRHWPLAATALNTLVSLMLLRLAHSSLAKIPLVSLLGRRFSLPVKRSYSIMIFCWRDPLNPLAGGGEVYLHEQAKSWVQAGHRVTWFAQAVKGSPCEAVVDGIHVVRRGKFPFVFAMGALWYLLKSPRDFDFIIDCMNGIPFFTPLFSTKPKVCLVYHVHSHHFRTELPPVLAQFAIFVETKLVPLIYRRTGFVTISESTRREMLELRMTKIPITLIHSGVSPALVPGAKSPAPMVLYLGRLKRYKRVRNLINAFAEIKQRMPDAQLVIAGTGDDEEPLREYVRGLGVAGVRFMGRVDELMKLRLMQEAWVFGMPSSIEGWGIVVIEANACGTPAVVYNVNGLREAVVDGKTGFIADSDREFTGALIRILEDQALRHEMSSDAIEWAQTFSWKRTATKTLETIRDAQPWRAIFEPVAGGSWILSSTSADARRHTAPTKR